MFLSALRRTYSYRVSIWITAHSFNSRLYLGMGSRFNLKLFPCEAYGSGLWRPDSTHSSSRIVASWFSIHLQSNTAWLKGSVSQDFRSSFWRPNSSASSPQMMAFCFNSLHALSYAGLGSIWATTFRASGEAVHGDFVILIETVPLLLFYRDW